MQSKKKKKEKALYDSATKQQQEELEIFFTGIYKLLTVILAFKIVSSVLKRLARMNFNGLQMLKLPLVT